MPRDKSASHEKIIVAAKAEFLEKGYEKASMRSIGERAGMTCAGLYRHYINKEDMFNALVEPAVKAMEAWCEKHMKLHYELVSQGASEELLFQNTAINLVRDVLYVYKEEFQLIFNCSQGTKYENFVHDTVEAEEKGIIQAMEYMKGYGHNIKPIMRSELHLLLSAYITALIEPIKHNWSKEETEHGLQTIEDFFMPGWKKIMGS